jgi:hypothetical protein
MVSRFRWQRGAWTGLGGVALVALMGAAACSESFSNNCASTRSCSPASEAGAGVGGVGDVGDGGNAGNAGDADDNASAGGASVGGSADGGGGGDSQAGEAGHASGGEAPGPCHTNNDCSNGDATDGEELCVMGVCQAGNAPPRVVSISPADGTEEVEPNVTVSVVFSEPLDPDTVSNDTFKLFAGDTEVTGTLKLSTSHDQLRFAPDQHLELWGNYRIELGKEIQDADGLAMLHDVSASFGVRDGVWSVKSLAKADAFELPSTLPAAPSGALLATWLVTKGTDCGASGTWSLEGTTSGPFASKLETLECSHVAASIAPDGSAIAAWGKKDPDAGTGSVWTQSFVAGSWAATDRQAQDYGKKSLIDVQVLGHDAGRISLLLDTFGYVRTKEIIVGPSRGTWSAENSNVFASDSVRPTAAFGRDGSGRGVWSDTTGVHLVTYNAVTKTWAQDAQPVPGTDATSTTRGPVTLMTSPAGDAMVLWRDGNSSGESLLASHFKSGIGWDNLPTTVNNALVGAALLDTPALVFDGTTFVCGWTAATGGKLTTYLARYDLGAGTWSEREAHVTNLGESAAPMPRLAADAQGNLMLVWAVGDDPYTLVYQRYRADTETWGEIQAVPQGTFTDTDFATKGKLPFGFAANGRGGVLFRTVGSGAQELKLASFF